MSKNEYIIRELELKDLPARVKWMNDERIHSHMSYEIPITMDKTTAWYKRAKENKLRKDLVLEHEGILVAMTGVVPDKNNKTAETYIFVNPSMHGIGLGELAWFGCLANAFYLSNFEMIYSITNADNVRSIAVSEKLGFTLIEERNQDAKNRLYYECEKSSFNKNAFNFEIKKNKIYIYK